jgi:hypothetical protein
MVALLSLSLILLVTTGCPTAGAGTRRAPSGSNGGPTIATVNVTPEHPAPGQQVTANIVVRDDLGVEGFRVIVEGKVKEVSCAGQKTCSRTFTPTIPDVGSRTLTLTVIALNTAGQRSRVEHEIVLAEGTRTAACGDGRCDPGESATCAEDCGQREPARPGTGKREVFLRSGFEAGVTLRPPEAARGGWEQYLTGADEGYDWSRSLPQRSFPRNRIDYLVSSDKDLQQYAETRIETVTGHDGRPTRALYMELKRDDPSTKAATRVQYGIYPPEDLQQAYASFRLKLQPDLASGVLRPGTKNARQLMEWKESGKPRADFRMSILVASDRNVNSLFWLTRAQFGDLQISPKAWECTSRVPVPVGEWFLFEVFWKQDRRDGRLWAAANGKTFVDYRGQTQRDSSVYVWWPFKVYGGTNLERFGGRSIFQWVDDVEFASEPPSALPPSREDSFTCQTY